MTGSKCLGTNNNQDDACGSYTGRNPKTGERVKIKPMNLCVSIGVEIGKPFIHNTYLLNTELLRYRSYPDNFAYTHPEPLIKSESKCICCWVGGGLIRSAGGWSEVKALRRIGGRQASEERILGSGKLVDEVTGQVELERK